VALRDPALCRIEKRVELAGFVAVLDVAGQLAQDRVELLLGVFRREVLGGGAGAVAGPPDDRAAGAAATGVAHVRGAKALGGSHAMFVAPEGVVGTLAALAFGPDLEMPCRASCFAHGVYDPSDSNRPTNFRRRRRGIFPQPFPRGRSEGAARAGN
jgi:hypothetical protein